MGMHGCVPWREPRKTKENQGSQKKTTANHEKPGNWKTAETTENHGNQKKTHENHGEPSKTKMEIKMLFSQKSSQSHNRVKENAFV